MPKFSYSSMQRLNSCAEPLQILMQSVVETHDCTIVEGHRSEARQALLFARGASRVEFPKSKHNAWPSRAVDVAPYVVGHGVSWDEQRCRRLAATIRARAEELSIPIRWGGDWDRDGDTTDQTFDDLAHYELLGD